MKMNRWTFVLVLGSLLIAACGGSGAPAGDATTVPVVADDFSVVAEGRLLPAQYANISFAAGGKVGEVLVAEGESVEAEAVIARLENSEALQAEVARAEAELVNAQQALDDLNQKNYLALSQAQADVANAKKQLDTAQRKLKNLNYPDVEWYQDQVDKTHDALQTAQENVEVVDIGQLSAALQAAKDALKTAEERYGKIKAAIDGCAECDPKRQVTVDFWPQTLDDAQDMVNDAKNSVRELEIKITQAERGNSQAIKDAQKDYDDAVEDLASAQRGAKPLDVEVAEGNVAVAEAAVKEAEERYAKHQNGPDPDQLEAAQARLDATKATLAAAKDALANSELKAPFAGVVADLKVKVGEQATPGLVAVVLADFAGWVVETDNLTEIEVVKISDGQQVEVVLDALPDVTLHGTVKTISPVFEEKRGDITYTVTISLTDSDPKMRWGMTAVTTFER